MRCDKQQIKLSGWQQELDADIARIGFKVKEDILRFLKKIKSGLCTWGSIFEKSGKLF